jgi:hypothetical protein
MSNSTCIRISQSIRRFAISRRRAIFAFSLAITVWPGGCVRRRLQVRTTPPGAVISVDNQTIGTSPAATSFTYYGTREVRIEKDGFRTETIKRKINPPWYQAPGLDFVTETLWPWEIRDERIIDVQLVPETIEPTSEVLQRADQLRNQSRAGLVTSPRSAANP